MIPEVWGERLGSGPPRKRVLKCLKGPKTSYTTIAIAEKQSKRSKKGPFLLFRRRLSAKPESNNRWKSDLGHVCMYVCMYGIWNYLANQGT